MGQPTHGRGSIQQLTADGSTSPRSFQGRIKVMFSSSFGGGTVILQLLDPEGNWQQAYEDATGSAVSATTADGFDVWAPDDQLTTWRCTISGSTTPTLLCWLQGGGLLGAQPSGLDS